MKKIITLFSLQKYVLAGLLCVPGIMHGIVVEEMVRNSRFREARPDVVERYEKALHAYENSADYQDYENTLEKFHYADAEFIACICVLGGTPDEPAPIDILSGNKSIHEINKQILLNKLIKAFHQRNNSQEHHDFWNAHDDTDNAYVDFMNSR